MFFLTTSFRIFHIRLLGICFLYLSTNAGTLAECPVQISPPSVVVKYGDSVSAVCKALVPCDDIGWEITEGQKFRIDANQTIWTVSSYTYWDIKPPMCFINYVGPQCYAELPVTIYNIPDSVSISALNPTGPIIEGKQYELQCDIYNVAPAQNLTVNWYKGETLVNTTSFDNAIKRPVNESAKLLINPDRRDNGAQFRCEAVLQLGEEGPQPPPNVTSDPFNISNIHYKPTINENKLPPIVSVVRGYQKELLCEADGNPKPIISWSDGTNTINNETFTVTKSTENLTCTATNAAGSDTRFVKVEIIENIMPITLGIIFVILVVAAILIYTYYKKPRRGNYNFKKPNAPKGLLAQPAQSA